MEEVRQDRDGGCGARRDADGTNPVLLHRLNETKRCTRLRTNSGLARETEIFCDATADYEMLAREMLLTINRYLLCCAA